MAKYGVEKERRIVETTVLGRVTSPRNRFEWGCTIAVPHSIGQRKSWIREKSMLDRGQLWDLPHGPRSRKPRDGWAERKATRRLWGRFVFKSLRSLNTSPSKRWRGNGVGRVRMRSVTLGATWRAERRSRAEYALLSSIVRCSTADPTAGLAAAPTVKMWRLPSS